MKPSAWDRWGAASGIAFVVLQLGGTFLYPQQPRIDSSAATTMKWVHDNRTALQIGCVSALFAVIALIWFVGHLRRVLEHSEGHSETASPMVFGSGIALAAVYGVGVVPLALFSIMDAQQGGLHDTSLIRMLGDLGQVLYAPAAALSAAFMFALGVALLRRELVAPWLGYVAIVVAACNLVGVVTSVSFSTYHAGGWLVVGWGAYVGFIAVVLVASISLLRRPESARSAVAPAISAN
jgi:hypothetical protein